MRIGVYVTAFPVLSETFVLNQIVGLVERGHDVEIVALRRGESGPVHDDVARHDLLGRLRLRGDSHERMPRSKWVRLGGAWRHWRGADRRERAVLRRSLNPFRYGKEAIGLALYFRAAVAMREDACVQVAHCHFGQHGEALARLRAIGAFRGAVVTTYHGEDLSRGRHGDTEPLRHAFAHGALHLPVSRAWAGEIAARGCPVERTRVHRMGVDVDRLDGPPARRSATEFTVLSVARFVEKKGLEYAIEGFRRFARCVPEARYRLLGAGPLAPDLRRRVAATGLGERIVVLGPADSWAVHREMRDADVFLLPSVTAADGDREGVPVVLMEAMAHRLPVVSTHHSGIPELVEDDVGGLLVAERDAGAIAAALHRLHGDAPLRRSIGMAARERVRRDFAIERLNDDLSRLLTDAGEDATDEPADAT